MPTINSADNYKLPKKIKKKKSKKAIEPINIPEQGQIQDTSNCADSAGALFNVSPHKRSE